MKKILLILCILCFALNEAYALNFGMYKPEEDYGLIDGFKLNLSKKDRHEKKQLFQLKSEVEGEKERMEKEKKIYEANKDKKADDEYQMFKFMLDDTVAF